MWERVKNFLSTRWTELKAWFKAHIRELLKQTLKGLGAVLQLYGIGFIIGLGFWVAFGIVLAVAMAGYAEASEIPRAAHKYRAELVRCARVSWGLNAPVAVFAAQVHTESDWNSEARSPVGAQGLAQFMPSTAKWLPEVAPETGQPAPFNPGWSLRALCAYDRWLWERTDGADDFERMAFTLSAYNGGLGWVNRDKKLAIKRGLDSVRWFGVVETVNAGRSVASWKENRNYPQVILKKRQYTYVRAGWGPGIEQGQKS